jgi:cytochrome c-type biogenesis protein CcmH
MKLLLILAILAAAASAFAQDASDDAVNSIAKKMYCPVCENIPLDACGTPACVQWREEIRTQLEAGKSEAEIINDFVQRFGDRVVGVPQDPTLNTLSLVTPWIISLVAVVSAVLIFLNWRANRGRFASADLPHQTIHTDDEYRTRLEADLTQRR